MLRLLGRQHRRRDDSWSTAGEIDYLVFDYLAEITMSLLARARAEGPGAGYVPDFVDADGAAPAARSRASGIKVVANAGGLNPAGCRGALAHGGRGGRRDLQDRGRRGRRPVAAARRELARRRRRRDVHRRAAAGRAREHQRVPRRAADRRARSMPARDIVITGRCVDSARDARAADARVRLDRRRTTTGSPPGSLAGHLIECGAQVHRRPLHRLGARSPAGTTWASRSPSAAPTARS